MGSIDFRSVELTIELLLARVLQPMPKRSDKA